MRTGSNVTSRRGQLPWCHAAAGQRNRRLATMMVMAAGLALSLVPFKANAVDGCQVLLCLASGNWRGISQCVPPVQQVLRDLARGKHFPRCDTGGPLNGAEHQWSNPPDFCPPQYTRTFYGDAAPTYQCDYTGAISVSINGVPFTRTWWSFGGDSVTEFSAAAKAQLVTWDTRFDDDYATWLAALPPPPADLP